MFLIRGVASHAPFNVWANEKINLVFFLHLVVTFCDLKKIAEPFFAKSCYKGVILSELDVHVELAIVAKLKIIFIFQHFTNYFNFLQTFS
jgi:hypothetical protein